MWKIHENYALLAPNGVSSNSDVYALFDYDGTLVVKANGAHAGAAETRDAENYVFLYGVEEKIRALIREGVWVVVITNQKGVFTEAKRQQFQSVLDHFCGRMLFMVSLKDDEYRKPRAGFVNKLREAMGHPLNIRYYCGDAIGNSDFAPYNWSSADREFAANARVPFMDPRTVFGSNYLTVSPEEDMVILVGNQGSGKTELAKRLTDRTRFSGDEMDLKGKKAHDSILDSLREGKKVVIDATHASEKSRRVWIELAKTNGKTWHILWLPRDGRPFNSLREAPVPAVAYSVYTKNFQRPLGNYTIVS